MAKSKTVAARLSQKALNAIAAIRAWHSASGVEISTTQVIESALIQHALTLTAKAQGAKRTG